MDLDQQHASGTLHADLLVLGFGKGGKAVAKQLAAGGRRVVLVERSERMYGGTCPNVGCIPTKGLVHRSGKRRPDDVPQDYYERSVEAVQAIREMMRQGNLDALEALESATVLTGTATFIDPHTVAVETGDGRVEVSADTILINTGAQPVIPDIPGLRDSRRAVLSTELIESTVLPERLVIVGGGYLGIEFAGIYNGFGSHVTLLEASPRILRREDDNVALAAEGILRDAGVEIVAGVRVTEIDDGVHGATVRYLRDGVEAAVEADTILIAAGRAPATADLALEAAGVRATAAGAVEVDEHLRTSQPHIYALGDVNGGEQHTYISLDDSRIVLDQLTGTGERSLAARVAIPHTLFMTPPLATVGLTERDARAAGRPIKVASERVADIVAMPRAYAVEETRGLMKFVIDAETDEILGAALLSVDAQELINTVALAMRHGITASQLRDSIYTHPSSTEAFNEVLGTIVRDYSALSSAAI
ncbi:FAD-dependent oxidoreductase [Solirubrobacter ginsenosidimutans]|uniref:FAD-dependent oxidoreductase n=1 Tax=Solirubrobacter ginsenosidimutans TaxID=490573 RepID=A0A9X3MNQ9_9ACTN|nr:FAD-dependent oxidoreductase [Solirubrobacter ginsenosidimutans]MDA0158996.1 FAD-dependent oxidoreductase [Solirubrobacter ginsenosidimutans]